MASSATMRRLSAILTLFAIICGAPPCSSAEDAPHTLGPVTFRYDNGLRAESEGDGFAARLQLRGQFRFTNLDPEGDPSNPDAVFEQQQAEVIRARFKLGGHLFRRWAEYYWEQDLVDFRVLDLRAHVQPWDWMGARVGQYKVLYNRERVESSGKQTFVERSVVTPPFTLDRQQGGTLVGHLLPGRAFDSRYAIGLFVGAGRGGDARDSGRPMFVGRWQWNFLGRDLDYSLSDIDRQALGAGSLAIGGAVNRSGFTQFSSSGGGQLPGFVDGDSDRYDIRQMMGEFAFQRRGLAINAEIHWKDIDDRDEGTSTDLFGYYAQAGYFFHEAFDWFPSPLELALRVAEVYADGSIPESREFTLGANWYFCDHRNKLTFDFARVESRLSGIEDTAWRARLQWDVSI